MAHKKAGGSTRNGRESHSKRLGVKRFGGERFQSTELDFMGPQIWRLLKQAESGSTGENVVEREVTFWA